MKSRSFISNNRFTGAISTSSLRNLLPMKQKRNVLRIRHESDAENVPPIDSNIQVSEIAGQSYVNKKSLLDLPISVNKQEDPVGIRKRSLVNVDCVADPHVKVFVRIRPTHVHDEGISFDFVRKVSPDSLIVEEQRFSFDSVLDSSALQEDVFKLVGMPLVKNALAGYNTSIVSYGQMGSGKSYTMWGPPSSMVDGHCNDKKGIVPRLFEMLFSEILKEQASLEGKQVTYQCRCSFLEVYNDQILDLLDPTQKNLKIKDDPRNGFFVENLTEDYVSDIENLIHLLIKGLSNRKLGGTGINSKSSKSHVIFTCVVESWRKGNYSSNSISGSKTSRMCFVDLAGTEKSIHVDSKFLNEEERPEISLSQLGRVVDLLSERAGSEEGEGIPYKNCRLTHPPSNLSLICRIRRRGRKLRESFGGNSKLSLICNLSSKQSCVEETLRTVRFGERVRCIHNEAVINEITADDVDDLTDQIRQLKEELINAKTGTSMASRETLNQLRISLNRSLMLPYIHTDSEEEDEEEEEEQVVVGMEDVKQLQLQIHDDLLLHTTTTSPFESCNTHITSTSSTSIDDLTTTMPPPPRYSNISSVAASIHKGMTIISHHNNSNSTSSSSSFSFNSPLPPPTSICSSCSKLLHHGGGKGEKKEEELQQQRERELEAICSEQAARIENLQQLLLKRQRGEERRELLLPWKKAEEESGSLKEEESGPVEEEDEEEERGRRWTERESEWICITEELRVELASNRRKAEKLEAELREERANTEEINDALQRSMGGSSRMVEHYTELQERYNGLGERYRGLAAGVAEMKKAAERAGGGGRGIARALVEELGALRLGRERERVRLRKENRRLRLQAADTADALLAAGDLLSRLRDSQDALFISQEEVRKVEEEKEEMKREMEDEKKRQKMEMAAMKQYLAESRLPDSALLPLFHDDHLPLS